MSVFLWASQGAADRTLPPELKNERWQQIHVPGRVFLGASSFVLIGMGVSWTMVALRVAAGVISHNDSINQFSRACH